MISYKINYTLDNEFTGGMLMHFKAYRLGDVVLLGGKGMHGRAARFIANFYPGSIASEYIRRTKDSHEINIPVLDEICKEHSNLELNNDKVVVHLRLGDVVCKSQSHKNSKKKPPSTDFIVSQIKNDKVNEYDITFICGNHLKTCYIETKKFLSDLKQKLPNATFHYSENGTASEADADFCRMINAKTFYQGRGNYSALVRKIRNYRRLDTNTSLV